MPVEYVNPATVHNNPAFSQAVILPAGARTLVIGGQNAVSTEGSIVGKGQIGLQAAKAIENLAAVLAAVGAGLGDIVKLTIYVVDGEDLRAAFGAWMARPDRPVNPPVISVIKVAGLANPDFLIEIEGLAVLPA